MIWPYDDLPDARLLNQTHVCERRRWGFLRQRMEHGGPWIGDPVDGSLRRDQGRIDERDGDPSALRRRAGLRCARWSGRLANGETLPDRQRSTDSVADNMDCGGGPPTQSPRR
jgi:hypothetical protein